MAIKENFSPIIKWAGGKEKELSHIFEHLPAEFDNYYEPFVGGGSVYMSIEAPHYFINDMSEELMGLYRAIAAEDEGVYFYLNEIDEAWNSLLGYVAARQLLVDTFVSYRNGTINLATLEARITAMIADDRDVIDRLLPECFIWNRRALTDELRKNIIRKMRRMYKLELDKGIMSPEDVYGNIETACMSALYMYFRRLYNNVPLRAANPELSVALFVFIRNYAYGGMFRYNVNGEFNVPYGGMAYNHKLLQKKIAYYHSEGLLDHFARTTMCNTDFEDFLLHHQPGENDFVFLDPPYDSEFSTYAGNDFTRHDHERLAAYLTRQCQGKWMMIIKNTPLIQALYGNNDALDITAFDKKYMVSFMNRNNRNAEHLIIKNYV